MIPHRRRLLSIVSMCPLLILPGCGGDGDSAVALDLEHLPVGGLGPVQAGTAVFRDSTTWSAFWLAHPRPFFPLEPAPAVDFARHVVAGVFAGAKPRCRTLEIHAGSLEGPVATLRYRVLTFGQSTPSSCVGTDPFTANMADLVLIPAGAAEVVFVDETA